MLMYLFSISESQYTMDINEFMRSIIIFGAFFINHIYLDIFLTVKQIDSFILNGITWGLFSWSTFTNPSKSTL